jgi:hypothetical protein
MTPQTSCVISCPPTKPSTPHTAAELTYKLTEHFNNLPQYLVKTLTWDRGMELANHEQLSRATGIKVYFAAPHSPWQRGTNENTNGSYDNTYQRKPISPPASNTHWRHRQPTKTTRPRKTPDYKTPLETHNQNVALTI